MTRLKSFDKGIDISKKQSKKSIWIILSVSVLFITIVILRTYAKYVFTYDDIILASGVVPEIYSEELLNGADPVLSSDLVPITIDEDGSVYKANLYRDWYKYEDKRWANAVVLRSSYNTLNSSGKVHGAINNGDSVSFDGVDDIIDLGLENYDFDKGLTIAANFKMNSLSCDVACTIIGNWENSGGGIYYYQGAIGANLYIKELNTYVYVEFPLNDTLNYHTVVMSFDGNLLRLYLDGKLVDSEGAVGSYNPGIMPFILGGNPFYNIEGDPSSGVSSNENGNINIKEYAIYERVLSDSEIKNNMKNRIGAINSEGLLSYGIFDNVIINNQYIPEENIESYFVWIPKYSYQLWDLGNYDGTTSVSNNKVHSIGIRFGLKNTSDGVIGECSTPGVAGSSGICIVGDYMTHPAFLAFDTTGLWVGKFETGYEGATTTEDAHQNIVSTDKIVIKSNEFSWRDIEIVNTFTNSYNYLRSSDSHLMKNTEWGAATYLSHSIYGINTEIRLHNNNSYLTGFSSIEIPTKTISFISSEGNRFEYVNKKLDGDYSINYFNSNSNISSTTGNYTGIYDMSGGAWEMNFAYSDNSDDVIEKTNLLSLYPDIFTNSNWNKYYDKYSSNSITNYTNRILGDATGELGPFWLQEDLDGITRGKSSWYNDYANFFEPGAPFINRGGSIYHGITNGGFAFGSFGGQASVDTSFRIVLAPKN